MPATVKAAPAKVHYVSAHGAACGVRPVVPPALTADPLRVTCGRCVAGRRFNADYAEALDAKDAKAGEAAA